MALVQLFGGMVWGEKCTPAEHFAFGCIWHIHLHLVAWICLRCSENVKHTRPTGGFWFDGDSPWYKCKKSPNKQSKKQIFTIETIHLQDPTQQNIFLTNHLKSKVNRLLRVWFGIGWKLGFFWDADRWQFASLTRKLRSCLGRSFNSCRFHKVRPSEKRWNK